LNVLDLFSGVGAFGLGLERAGMRVVAFCERDLFCRRVLAKHWPAVPIYDDVRTLTAARLAADGIAVDVVCGGWPCQDISVAGNGAGLAGERSGLWSEFARILGEVRPRHAIMENVAALLGRGLGDVLGDLAALGYDCEWHCIPASDVGAPHRRDRVWIIAHAERGAVRDEQQRMPGGRPRGVRDQGQAEPGDDGAARSMAHADGGGRGRLGLAQYGGQQGASGDEPDGCGATGRRNGQMADAGGARLSLPEREPVLTAWRWAQGRAVAERGWWRVEPDVGRVVDGPAARVDRRPRLAALGNSLVPDIPEIIGRALLAQEGIDGAQAVPR
jgi:DNA (cytosine-5)-methyltransferase 1